MLTDYVEGLVILYAFTGPPSTLNMRCKYCILFRPYCFHTASLLVNSFVLSIMDQVVGPLVLIVGVIQNCLLQLLFGCYAQSQ